MVGDAIAITRLAVTRFAASPLPVPRQDPDTSRAKAQAILSQRQFQHPDSVMTRVVRWLGERLGGVVTDLLSGGWGSALAWLIVLVCIGLIVVLVVVVVRATPTRPERDVEAPLRVEVRRGSQDWTAEAERLEAQGQWKAGMRCRYRALTSELVAEQLVRDLPGRTSGEYRNDLSATLPDARDDFGAASELFERAWYGDRPTGADERDRFGHHAAEVKARAARRAGRRDHERVPS
jgi:Domain of unknown function (DUF4129)